MKIHALLILFLVALTSCGGSNSNLQTGPAGLNGTWHLAGVTCNGQPGTGSLTVPYTAPNQEGVTIDGNSGTGSLTYVVGGSACQLSFAMSFSFPAVGQVHATPTGNISCSPDGCMPGTCGQAAGSGGDKDFSYTLIGNQLTLTTTANPDQTCSTASPAQQAPSVSTYTR